MADYAMLLREQVTLTCRPIDRILLQGYVPRLQSDGHEWAKRQLDKGCLSEPRYEVPCSGAGCESLRHSRGVPALSGIGAGLASIRRWRSASGPIAEGSQAPGAEVTLAACSGAATAPLSARPALPGPRRRAGSPSASACDLVNGEAVSMRVKGDRASSYGEQSDACAGG